ncbi:MAG: response regulator transcription factor [Hydrotalea sp.]|nr:response regulator transcription factor [Hydrotalea sp.]
MDKNISNDLGYRPLVLVVDDDDELCDLLKKFLNQHGFVAYTARSANQAKTTLQKHNFAAVVLDVQMTGQDGLSLLKEWRANNNDIPIMMLTAMGKEAESRVLGLSSGADDYLAKPFEPAELVLRLSNIIRRKKPTEATLPSLVKFGRGQFDRSQKKLEVDGARVYLTSAEERLFCYLLDRNGRAVSREELNQAQIILGGERSIDVHIARIRQKIGDRNDRPEYLVTIRHKGYEMRVDHE